MVLGDLEGDGDLDAVTAHQLEGTYAWINDGLGGFEVVGPLLRSDGDLSVAIGDVDGDGDLDLVVGADQDRLYLNDGSGTFTEAAAGAITDTAHTFADNGTYTVTVTVAETGGAISGADTFNVVVANVVPVVTAQADDTVTIS